MDPKRQRVQAMIDHFFPKSVGIIDGDDRTGNRFLVREISDVKPPTYYLLDLEKKSVGLIKNEGPWIDPARMRPMQILSYKARDGAQLQGFLTLPAGASKEHRVPLVVLPHGGPWRRVAWGWDGAVQFLASRGYAVFEPNYRGSAGSEWRFAPDDRWDFTKMHNDVTDGTKALVKSGLIDPQRVAIMGYGFGGYLAIRGAADEPNLYCCALTIGGAFDFEPLLKMERGRDDPFVYKERHYLDSQKSPDEKYSEISVLKRAGNIKIPVFITNNVVNQSSFDITTIRVQTFELSHALPGNTPTVVFGDLHLDSYERAFVDSVGRIEGIEDFLAKYLAPGPASASALGWAPQALSGRTRPTGLPGKEHPGISTAPRSPRPNRQCNGHG